MQSVSIHPLGSIQCPQFSQQFLFPLGNINPKVPINIVRKHFLIKTVETQEELREVLRLRYDVFYTEMQNKPKSSSKLDFDAYDKIADHLYIKDLRTDEIIGTYRVICSDFQNQFYSQSEFYLDKFLNTNTTQMEVSRACVKSGYRNGITISLLWQGIAEYALKTNSGGLFGCSSIWSHDVNKVSKLYLGLLGEQKLVHQHKIKPLKAFECRLDSSVDLEDYSLVSKELCGALLQGYFRAGARLFGLPAWDGDFGCFDFFTALDLTQTTDSYKKRYLK